MVAARDPAKTRASDKARYQRDKPKRYALTKSYMDRYPEKRRAHSAVSNAIRDGRMKREPCEVCGDKKSHAHHDDYSKPLDVRWLCQKHHTEHHRAIRVGA